MREPWSGDPDAEVIRGLLDGEPLAVRVRFRLLYRAVRIAERSGITQAGITARLHRVFPEPPDKPGGDIR